MIFGSVCSGIEAASAAWHPLGWQAAFYSEIEKFPCAALAHHYPETPNYGDMTQFKEWPDATLDVLVGGTPCQSFSVAGLRAGLADPRGNLMLTYLAIADRYRPEWLVWENVPGVLSSGGGRDFGTFLGGLAKLGYGFAYRVLDAQYFGVPQRRRRVFVVANSRDWRRAAAVLLERESLRGGSAPSRAAGEAAPDCAPNGTGTGGEWPAEIGSTINAHYGDKWGLEDQRALNGAALFVPVCAFGWQASESQTMNPSAVTPSLDKSKTVAVAFDLAQITSKANRTRVEPGLPASTLNSLGQMCVAPALTASNDPSRSPQSSEVTQQVFAVYAASAAVRRLTPRECERLQGFPDDYTAIPFRGKPAADGPRYKALGNSMAVPVMRWIGERIEMVSELCMAGAA